MVLPPPIVAISKQYYSIVTSTKSLTSNDIPFGWKINVIRNKIKTTAINKDSGTNTNVNIANDISRVISLPIVAKDNQVKHSLISYDVTFFLLYVTRPLTLILQLVRYSGTLKNQTTTFKTNLKISPNTRLILTK